MKTRNKKKPKAASAGLAASRNVLRIDPTRTGMMRKAFSAKIKGQFRKLRLAIIDLIVTQDALGLKDRKPFTGNQQIPVEQKQYASVQFNINVPAVVEQIKLLQKSLDPADVVKMDEQLHITVLYGLDPVLTSPESVQCLTKGFGIYSATISRLSLFEAENYDVLKFDIDSSALHRLHGLLTTLPHTLLYSTYQPHLTVAYLKKGTGAKYLDSIIGMQLLGYKVMLRDFVYSDVERTHEELTVNDQWRFHSDPEKLKAFKAWLAKQMDSTVRGKTERDLWEAYIHAGFEKGAGRSFDDFTEDRPERWDDTKLDFYQGTRKQFLRDTFARPETIEKVQLIAARTFDDLVGVTDRMATKMGRVLADGLTQGMNPRDIGKELADEVDIEEQRAETIARTEIIRAHAEGQLDAMEALGVEDVGVMVEWSTALDDRVCLLCEPMEGVTFSLEEAHGMIPRHPNAVFAGSTFIPYGECKEIVRAWYSGPAIVLSADRGEYRTTIGPNHPMLTRRGLVKAAELDESDEVLYDTRVDDPFAFDVLHIDDEQVPTVENVFQTCLRVNPDGLISSSGSDLHGDRIFCQGEVEAIRPARGLLTVLDSFGIELLRKDDFVWTDSDAEFMSGFRNSFLRCDGNDAPASSDISLAGESLSVDDRYMSHSIKHSFAAISRSDAALLELSNDNAPRTFESDRQSEDAFSAEKQFGDLIGRQVEHFKWLRLDKIELTTYTGWAFDATTQSSLYCSSGFVVSNCRCSFIPANVGEDTGGQTRDAEDIRGAIKESMDLEGANPVEEGWSAWGTGKKISEDRPESLIGEITNSVVHNIIHKLPNGKYQLMSHSGKNLGTFDSEDAAKKHEQEVEYFKRADNLNAVANWAARHGLEYQMKSGHDIGTDEISKIVEETTGNAFCATGPGGGIDPSCSPGGGGSGTTGGGDKSSPAPSSGEKLGVVARFKALSDAATAKVSGAAKALYNKLPKPAQKVVDMAHALHHKLEETKQAGQKLAVEVARQRGLSEKNVERVGRILNIADNINKWSAKIPAVGHPVSVALHHIGGPVGVIGHELANYVPAASLAYVGYSMGREALAGRNPLKMISAARERVTKQTHNVWTGVLLTMNDQEFAAEVTEWFDTIPEDRLDWAEALLSAALDEANGDKKRALQLAKAGYDPKQDLSEFNES